MSGTCGTYKGYQRHKRHGEDACAECLAANATYIREYRRSTPERTAAYRASNRATGRALHRLRDLHYAEFLALLAEERSR